MSVQPEPVWAWVDIPIKSFARAIAALPPEVKPVRSRNGPAGMIRLEMDVSATGSIGGPWFIKATHAYQLSHDRHTPIVIVGPGKGGYQESIG